MAPTHKLDDKKNHNRRSVSKERKYSSPSKEKRQDNVTKYLEERKTASRKRAILREKEKQERERKKKEEMELKYLEAEEAAKKAYLEETNATLRNDLKDIFNKEELDDLTCATSTSSNPK